MKQKVESILVGLCEIRLDLEFPTRAARAKRTKDILSIMKMLGHKNIKNTLIYTQLLSFQEDNKFLTKVAMNTKEACE